MKTMITGLFASALLLAGSARAEEPGQLVAEKGTANGVAPCSSCHGAAGGGNPAAGFPALAGQEEAYLLAQLNQIRSGDRASPVMAPAVKALTDEEAEAVARYYAGLPVPEPSAEAPDEATTELAEALVRHGDWPGRDLPSCESCHGPDGRGVGAAFPALASQNAAYLKAQLLSWQRGERKTDPGDLMGTVARKLTEEEIEAVSTWLAAQPRGAR